MDNDSTEIRRLNDQLRKELKGGQVLFMGELAGWSADRIALQHRVLGLVRTADIDPDNDPYGEADFGKVECAGEEFFWKIDYYDLEMKNASEDPANPALTKRVMTVMKASDY